jgi:dTMP kinase
MRGAFITFEGPEGCGKSTQLLRLLERLRGMGKQVRHLREPGGTPIGEEIRHLLQHSSSSSGMTPQTELLLVNASRAQLVREVIRPALERGEIVLCDRFYDSTLAYQGYGRGIDLDLVRQITSFAVGETIPDLTLLLVLPVSISEERVSARNAEGKNLPDRFEKEGRDFFLRVEEGYRRMAASEPLRIKLIDATTSLETVEEQVWEHVRLFLGGRGFCP